jgi:hypothetical protein
MPGVNGGAYLAWHAVDTAPKDGGRRLREWVRVWEENEVRAGVK